MCLAVPVLLKERRGDRGMIELGGVERDVNLSLTPEAQAGDYLIVHAGFAIELLDEEEAQATLALFQQMEESENSAALPD